MTCMCRTELQQDVQDNFNTHEIIITVLNTRIMRDKVLKMNFWKQKVVKLKRAQGAKMMDQNVMAKKVTTQG